MVNNGIQVWVLFCHWSLASEKSIAVFNNLGTPNLFCPCFILKIVRGFYGRVSALSIDEKTISSLYQTRLHTHIHKDHSVRKF